MREVIKKKKVVKCKICGKQLTTVDSIQRGYGDACFKKILERNAKRESLIGEKIE